MQRNKKVGSIFRVYLTEPHEYLVKTVSGRGDSECKGPEADRHATFEEQ